jgi:hypothetical protein
MRIIPMGLTLLVIAGVVVGCSSHGAAATTTPASAVTASVQHRLAVLAYEQAAGAGVPDPRWAAFVVSHRAAAEQVSSGGTEEGSSPAVFLVEVVGPFTHYPITSPPLGAAASTIRCVAISFTVDRATWGILDSGCARAFNLSALGRVYPLAPLVRAQGSIVTVGGPSPGSSRPIAGADIWFIGAGGSASVRADKHGVFAFDVTPGTYRVRLTGHAPTTDGEFFDTIPDTVVVTPGDKPIRLVVSIK